MADVTVRFERHDSARGQLLLLGGVVLAVIFVGIALVLNGSIFAENLATRQSGGTASDIQALQSAVSDGTQDRSRTVTHVADGDSDTSGGCPL